MFTKKLLLPTLALTALTLIGHDRARADLRIRVYQHSDGATIMGREIPAVNDTNVMWFGDGKACMQMGDSVSIVLDSKEMSMALIDHAARKYSQLSLNEAFHSDDPQVQQMLAMMTMDVTVEPTKERQKIGDWDCRKYVMTKKMPMMVTNSECWATKDIEIDPDMYGHLTTSAMAYFPDYAEIVKEYGKIDGVVVKESDTVEVMGQKMVSTMQMVDEGEQKAPAGIYDIPKDYEQVELQPPGMH